ARLGVIGGAAGDQDVGVVAADQGARRRAGNEQIAPAVAAGEDIAAVAHEDVVRAGAAAIAAGDVLHVQGTAAGAGAGVGLQVNNHIAAVGAVVQGVGAAATVDRAGEALAVAEDEAVVVRPTHEILDPAEGDGAVERAAVGTGNGPGVGRIGACQ